MGGITPQHLAAYAAAGANGFGLGSVLYKPGMDVPQVKAKRLGIRTGLARDHRAGLTRTYCPTTTSLICITGLRSV